MVEKGEVHNPLASYGSTNIDVMRDLSQKKLVPELVALPEAKRGYPSKSWLFSMLNPCSRRSQAKIYQFTMTCIILVDVAGYIFSTVPSFQSDSGITCFYAIEALSSSVFALDYFARLWVIGEDRRYEGYLGRLRYALSMESLLDALATFPFFVELMLNADLPNTTYFRIFRLFRMLRTQSYMRAFLSAYRVVYYNSEILAVAFAICAVLTLITSVLMYYLAPPADELEDPSDFESIPATMYLAILMLTGQGGPQGELPWYTKCIMVLTAVFSVAVFAIPASIYTWGFEHEAMRLFKRKVEDRRKAKKAVREGKVTSWFETSDDSDSDSSNTSGEFFGYSSDSSAWEDYEAAGLGDEGEEDESAKVESTPPRGAEYLATVAVNRMGASRRRAQKTATAGGKGSWKHIRPFSGRDGSHSYELLDITRDLSRRVERQEEQLATIVKQMETLVQKLG